MSSNRIPPNELADLYESLDNMLDVLSNDTHPAWELAIESVLFGGEAIAPSVTCYGEQQAERNEFKISDYREQYGDGERITTFPTLTTRSPTNRDTQHPDREIQVPVAPDSGTTLPLFVDTDTLPDAISLLNEFPTAPSADTSATSSETLLNPNLFPGLEEPSTRGMGAKTGQSGTDESEALDVNQIEELVDNISMSSTGENGSTAGGETREKFTCKCCGTRVDSGKHKCSGCVEAGCSFGDKRCKF